MDCPALLETLSLRGRLAPSRVVFATHPTNLAVERRFNEAHVAYYGARAAGGAGVVVTEPIAVHETSRPLEYTIDGDLGAALVPGLRAVSEAVHAHGALCLAHLDHAGGQGSSHWNQRELLAPSPFPEVNSREVPKVMDRRDADDVVAGFRRAAALAMEARVDGVEVNAGQHSLLRQFLSPLTNQRDDELGGDLDRRLRLLREVLATVRGALGDDGILVLRLSGDEHAPWAGIKPEDAAEIATHVVRDGQIDALAITNGGPFTAHLTRAGLYAPPQHAAHLGVAVKNALRDAGLGDRVVVFSQGSIVDVDAAHDLVTGDDSVDAVEMTRALIADPDLVAKLRGGRRREIRPCILCNQDCSVSTVQNPRVGCVHHPAAGHELDVELSRLDPAARPRRVLIVGAGPAGLEAARAAAARGHDVTVFDRREAAGGALRHAAARAPGRERLDLAVAWLDERCRDLEVTFRLGEEVTVDTVDELGPDVVLLATGGRPQPYPRLDTSAAAIPVAAARQLLDGSVHHPDPPGRAVIVDEEGGHAGMGAAELLHHRGFDVTVVTADMFAGQRLTATQELTPWNQRAHGQGIAFVPQRQPVAVVGRSLVTVDIFSREEVPIEGVDLVVTAAYELPDDELYRRLRDAGRDVHRVGDAVAPRRLSQAVLEGTRIGRSI